MKFQPARHTSAPHSRLAGKNASSEELPTRAALPIARLLMSFSVHTSGDGGGAIGTSGATHALPIVENDIGSQKMCTPTPCVRMSVWRMPLMRNVESMLATPGTEDEPDRRFTVSPKVAVASSTASGRGIVHTTSSITGTFPKEHRRHFSAAAGPGACPRPNGIRFTRSCESAYLCEPLTAMLRLLPLAIVFLLRNGAVY